MWRIWRGVRSPFASRRLRKEAMALQHGELQRYSIRRPFKFRHLAYGAIAFYVCFTIFNTVVLNPWAGFLDKQLANMSIEELEELKKKMEEPSFWPVPLTIRSVPAAPYKGSDPEWQAFIKFAKDRKAQMKIRAQLAELVRRVASANPILANRCGKNWKVKRIWLDADFPFAPPPKYLQSGLEWNLKNEVYWADREIDSATAHRIQRALWPAPVAHSAYTFFTSLAKQNALGVTKWLGYESTAEPDLQDMRAAAFRKSLDRFQQPSTKHPEAVDDPAAVAAAASKATGQLHSPNDGASNTSDTDSRSGKSPEELSASPSDASSDNSGLPKTQGIQLYVPHQTVKSHISGPWEEMKKSFRKHWRPMRNDPPRGSFRLSGFVELEADRSIIVIDVFSWYDPKRHAFDKGSMWMSVRREAAKRQAPKKQ